MKLDQKYCALLDDMQTRNVAAAKVQDVRLCFQVLSLASAMDRDCALQLGKHGLTEGRFVLLFLLRQEPNGLSPFELAEKAGITRATVTGLLDGLEKQALLTRHHDQADRRMVTVRLTPQGQQMAERLTEEHSRWIAQLLSGLSTPEKAEFSRLLGKAWHSMRQPES